MEGVRMSSRGNRPSSNQTAKDSTKKEVAFEPNLETSTWTKSNWALWNKQQDFADSTDKIDFVSAFGIYQGMDYFCHGWQFYQPGYFVLTKRDDIDAREDIQKELNTYLNDVVWPAKAPYTYHDSKFKMKNQPKWRVYPEDVLNVPLKGLYVAAFFQGDFKRGIITNTCMIEGKLHCHVYIMDFGEHPLLPLRSLRRIPKYLLKTPALAIQCGLEFEGQAQHLNKITWTEGEARIFWEIMQDCRFQVTFIRREVGDENLPDRIIWKVKVQLKILKNQRTNEWENTEWVTEKFLKEVELRRLEQEKKGEQKDALRHDIEGNFWQEVQLASSITRMSDNQPGSNVNSNQAGVYHL